MPTTTSPLTPATHGLRVAASFNLHSEAVMEKMCHDPRGQRAAEDGSLFLYKMLIM